MTKDHHAEFMTLLTGLPGKGKNRIQQEVWRYVNVVDVEHGGCKIGIYVPKLPGRGGSISANPRKQAAHCHPVCHAGFQESISSVENKRIKEIAGNPILAFKRAVFAKTWMSPTQILGEKCWNRPGDYLLEPY